MKCDSIEIGSERNVVRETNRGEMSNDINYLPPPLEFSNTTEKVSLKIEKALPAIRSFISCVRNFPSLQSDSQQCCYAVEIDLVVYLPMIFIINLFMIIFPV